MPTAVPAVVEAPPVPQGLEIASSAVKIVVTTAKNPGDINWNNVLYVVFDLETTGRARHTAEIIEIAAVILNKHGVPLEDAQFCEFCKPYHRIPAHITVITSIQNKHVKRAPRFGEVAGALIRFLKKFAEDDPTIEHLIFVGHNAKAFDNHIFIQQLTDFGMIDEFFGDKRFGLGLDTLVIARGVAKKKQMPELPTKNNLTTLYQFVSGKKPIEAHRALSDVKSTATILRYTHFWNNRMTYLYAFKPHPQLLQRSFQERNVDEDSEDGVESVRDATEAMDSDSESEDEENDGTPLGDRWVRDADFADPNPTPKQQFVRVMESSRRTPGLQPHPIDVGTVRKSWRSIFTGHLLNKIVKYTNEYGELHAKDWVDIDQKELECFIAVLFISGIQKRKDKPSHWFSDNRMLESPLVKRVMTGRKFFTILRYLHCCPVMYHNTASPDYNPAYKVAEIRDYLESRYRVLFEPEQQLSLDETLIRAFGRMKFKVRIITKAARYGIKVYVLTDARTAYVLRVIFYTGKSTYHPQPDEETKKKTVQVVSQLVSPYAGSHRTVYVDRFYTSLDLVKELAEMDLYITGTVMQNRIPSDVRVLKTSDEWKKMKRGDAIKGKCIFKKQDGSEVEAGLVCWRDRQIVYCLSNDTNNFEMDMCKRRGEGGLLDLTRPISIARYNQYMGGVDLADMRRLHCSSTIMGQNRWWLKLFFYLLDVGTSNANILYNEAMRKIHQDDQHYLNIHEYKTQLVEALIGKNIDELMEGKALEEEDEHVPVLMEDGKRSRCVLCTMDDSTKLVRTSFMCACCGVPLCCIGSSRGKRDCFGEAHKHQKKYQEVLDKHFAMKKLDRSKK